MEINITIIEACVFTGGYISLEISAEDSNDQYMLRSAHKSTLTCEWHQENIPVVLEKQLSMVIADQALSEKKNKLVFKIYQTEIRIVHDEESNKLFLGSGQIQLDTNVNLLRIDGSGELLICKSENESELNATVGIKKDLEFEKAEEITGWIRCSYSFGNKGEINAGSSGKNKVSSMVPESISNCKVRMTYKEIERDNENYTPFVNEGLPDKEESKELLIMEILPKFHNLKRSPPTSLTSVKPHIRLRDPSQLRASPTQSLTEANPCSSRKKETFDPNDMDIEGASKSDLIQVIVVQTREMERRLSVARRAANDVVELRRRKSELEAENQILKETLAKQQKSSTAVNDPMSNNVIIAANNHKLEKSITQFQNQLAKDGGWKRKYYELREAHCCQQMLLQNLQERLVKFNLLQKTCKDQEEVIEILEKQLKNIGDLQNGDRCKDVNQSTDDEITANPDVMKPCQSVNMACVCDKSQESKPPPTELITIDDHRREQLLKDLHAADRKIEELNQEINGTHAT